MQLINKAHPLIAPGADQAKSRASAFVRVSGKEVYFSALACRQYELVWGEYIEFITIENRWHFVKSLDDKLGFKLNKKTKTSLRIVNTTLAKMILRGYKILNFNLEKTTDDYGKFPLIALTKT